MSYKVPSSWKQCSTCVYWVGPREIDFFGNWVTLDSTLTKGRCMCRGSGSYRVERGATLSCNSYVKWPVLS